MSTPFSLFNELGFSLVRGGSWIGCSHEIEYDDGAEIRTYGWRLRDPGRLLGAYARIWIGKNVFVVSGEGFKAKKKGKRALKCILGFEYRNDSPKGNA